MSDFCVGLTVRRLDHDTGLIKTHKRGVNAIHAGAGHQTDIESSTRRANWTGESASAFARQRWR